jgi:hypothetical protein
LNQNIETGKLEKDKMKIAEKHWTGKMRKIDWNINFAKVTLGN